MEFIEDFEYKNRNTEDYNGPLHANSSMLRKLDELLPKFVDLDNCMKHLEVILKNGAICWRKPL